MDRPGAKFLRGAICCCIALAGGCVKPTYTAPWSVENLSVPPVAELDPPQMQYYIAADEDTTMFDIVEFFAQREMLARYDRSPDAVRLVSRYTEEPQEGEEFRRVAYAVKIQPVVLRPECTWVEVRWFLESRPFDSPSWRPQSEPPGYRPLWADALDSLLRRRKC